MNDNCPNFVPSNKKVGGKLDVACFVIDAGKFDVGGKLDVGGNPSSGGSQSDACCQTRVL